MVLSTGYVGGAIGLLIGARILDITQSLDLSLVILIGVSLTATFLALRVIDTGRYPELIIGKRPVTDFL
jgi:hypothetical protein